MTRSKSRAAAPTTTHSINESTACSRMLTYAHVCSGPDDQSINEVRALLAAAKLLVRDPQAAAAVAAGILTYADIC
jgi:hypothetical protein